MKRYLVLVVSLTMFLMAGCGSTTEEVEDTNSKETVSTSMDVSANVDDVAGLSESFEGALPAEAQLIVGTFLLESTELAVDSDQAGTLLPLWKAYNSLLQSDTTAQAEVTAVFEQIRDSMTMEQIDAIASMQITQESMSSLFEELGLDFGNRGAGEGTGESAGEFPAGGFPGGQLPDGVQPGGGQGFGGQGGGQELSPEQIATLQAERGNEGRPNNMMTTFLVEPLIELLESKTT